jgi:hypothetical protein
MVESSAMLQEARVVQAAGDNFIDISGMDMTARAPAPLILRVASEARWLHSYERCNFS